MSLLLSGKIQALLDRLTSARASNLDSITETRQARLDATVSSRASATAVQTIDNNVDTILARVPSTVATSLELATLPGIVKSVQSGFVIEQITSSGSGPEREYYDVTVSAVTVAKCVVLVDGLLGEGTAARSHVVNGADTETSFKAYGRLTSTTNLRLFSPKALTSTGYLSASWQVVEYY